MSATPMSPPRTRPRNRRESILREAANLFGSRGYHNVSTEDIAAAVGIGASALYRHVHNKHELLELALMAEFDPVRRALRDAAPHDIDDAIEVLARGFGEHRHMGLLWSRESRHLDDDARQRIREPFFEVRETLMRLLEDGGSHRVCGDPELTAMAILAVLTSPAYHQTPMSGDRIMGLVRRLSDRVVRTPLTVARSGQVAGATADGVMTASRPIAIMNAATSLFSVRGYQTVTMQDIGAAVGATSASLYRHFPTKGDLLTAILTRGTDALHVGLARALAAADTPQEALAGTVASYVEFATHHRELLNVLVAEPPNIPEPARGRLRAEQRAYVDEWFALQAAARPDLDRAEARFRVHAALTIVNDAVRTTHLNQHAGFAVNLIALAESVLEVAHREPAAIDTSPSSSNNDRHM